LEVWWLAFFAEHTPNSVGRRTQPHYYCGAAGPKTIGHVSASCLLRSMHL
jgi:hypothetical protein